MATRLFRTAANVPIMDCVPRGELFQIVRGRRGHDVHREIKESNDRLREQSWAECTLLVGVRQKPIIDEGDVCPTGVDLAEEDDIPGSHEMAEVPFTSDRSVWTSGSSQ